MLYGLGAVVPEVRRPPGGRRKTRHVTVRYNPITVAPSMKESQLKGVVADDPLSALPVGSELQVEPLLFGWSDATAQVDGVRNWTFFEGALLAIGVRAAGLPFEVRGSAVMLAPGLAVSATHVVVDILADLADGNASALCLGPRTGQLDLWRLRSISTVDQNDIMFLSLELASAISSDWRIRTLPITTRTPSVGEDVTIIGFTFLDTAESLDGAGYTARGDLLAAAGKVRNVYHPRRDSVLLPFPTIEIECGSRGGMSGGAVLDRDGSVLGVISRGWDDTGPPVSAAWIVGGLDRELEMPWPPSLYDTRAPLLSIPERLLNITGRDAIVDMTPGHLTYRIWFDEAAAD